MVDAADALGQVNLAAYVALMMIGFYAMIAKANLVKKLIGMTIFQWSIILFIVSLGAKRGATIPIVESGQAAADAGAAAIEAARYVNPLPHVLMLTAIVVGVATTGVALSLLLRIHRRYGTLEEDAVRAQLRDGGGGGGP